MTDPLKIESFNWSCTPLGYHEHCNTQRRCIKNELVRYSKVWIYLSDQESEECYYSIMENRNISEISSIPKRWKLFGKQFIPPPMKSNCHWRCPSHIECIRIGRVCIYHELKIYCEQWSTMSSDQRSDFRRKLSLGRSSKEMSTLPGWWHKFLVLINNSDADPRKAFTMRSQANCSKTALDRYMTVCNGVAPYDLCEQPPLLHV